MNYRYSIFIISLIILSSTYNLCGEKIELHSNIKIIFVDSTNTEGPWDGTIEYPYQYIQDAINNSIEGNIIFVLNGTYYEHITLNKAVTIIGENQNNTIIDSFYKTDAIQITHDNVNIMNFTIRNSGGYIEDAGIKIYSNNNIIKDCILYKTKTGLYIEKSNNNNINNCSINTNGEGILLKNSNNNIIEGCCLNHNAIGLNIDTSQNTLVKHSYFYANGIAGHLNSSSNIEITHCNISDNSVNLGGMFIVECSNIYITNCNICHNGAGLHLYSSTNIIVNHCDLNLNTHFAIAMRTPSKNIKISECNIKNNFRYGLYLENKNSCELVNNNICNNTLYAIYSKSTNCKAKLNWWGSKLGPSYYDLRPGKRITYRIGKIKCSPWSLKPIENIGSNWEENTIYMDKKTNNSIEKKYVFPGDDSDNDGLPDWWEEKWGYNKTIFNDHINLDPDNDALNNFEECYTHQYGSNPFHKDIFLEIDWMESLTPDTSNKPPADLIQELISIFKEKDITLHIDLGEYSGGEEIPCSNTKFSFPKLRDIYWNYFLHNKINNPRKGIFHYGIICNYCPDLNFPFFGWDNMDSFAISAEWLKEELPLQIRGHLIVGATVHHLGHSLGLLADTYGGIDNVGATIPFSVQWWKYHNYKSSMNYAYKYKLLSYSDGTHGFGDFDDWSNLDFSFFKNSHFEWPKN